MNKLIYFATIFCLSFFLLIGCKNQDSSSKPFEMTVRGEVFSHFNSQTLKKELENLTSDCTEDCFLILAISDETYLQTYYTKDQNQFDLEYRDGDESRHFREVSGQLTLTEIQNVFNNYYENKSDWSAGINWEPLE